MPQEMKNYFTSTFTVKSHMSPKQRYYLIIVLPSDFPNLTVILKDHVTEIEG